MTTVTGRAVERARAGGRLATMTLAGLGLLAAPLVASQQIRVVGPPPGFLGIQYQIDRTVDLERRTTTDTRYWVTDVVQGGAADRAGIRAGDRVIEINGMVPSEAALMGLIRDLRAGDSVQVVIRREDARSMHWVIAEPRPAERVTATVWTGFGQRRDAPQPERTARASSGQGRGVTILLESDRNDGTTFTYQVESLDPEIGVPFQAFVLQTPRTDSLAALIREVDAELRVAQRDNRSRSRRLSQRLASLQNELARTSQRELRVNRLDEGGTVPVRLGSREPLSPLTAMQRPYFLGAEISSVNAELGRFFGVDGGVLVNTAYPGTPAYEVGLRAGDVIVALDDERIRGITDLRSLVRGGLDSSTELALVREGERVVLQLR